MRAFFHHLLLAVILLPSFVFSAHSQERYPVHVMVELPPPHSVYLEDYVTGSRDRMVVTLLNRDAMRAELEVKLELEVSGVGFRARSRGEVYHSRLVLDAGVPLRLGSETLGEYLRQGAVETEGMPSGGRLPVGMTEFRVRAVDYATGRALSEWASRRIWLDERKPPVLNSPGDGESLAWKEQQRIRFGWMPMHAGMSGTEYEIVIKEIPDNGVPASESFSYGRELLRERTRRTFHIHDMGYEPLYAGRRYAWQVRALAAEGAEPVSYANGGYSEIWSFTVDERMLSPVGLNAEAKPGRVKLMWGAVPGSSGYVVQMREKSGERDYEWKETESADEGTEFHNLRNGWAYEWRVGSRNASGRRYWSGVSEFVVPERAEDLLKDCGKVPGERSLSGEPYLSLKVGDIVTVGGDYPMEVTEVTSLGDGWYSGEGRTRIRSIIDAPVRLVFDRVRINTELFQTDGEVKVGYDESNGLIVETDRLDDGGEGIKGKSGVSYPEGYVEAVFPESPEFEFVEGSGELRFKDAEGRDQVFRLGDASLQGEGEDGRKIGGEVGFPVLLTDKNGTTYKVYPKEGSDSTGHRQMVCEKLERLEGFDSSRLSLGAGEVRFEKGDGEYGFDAGEEKWYAKSVKLDRYYKASGRGYIAPWKLLPKGRRDHVVARYVGSGRVKPGAVRFATKDGTVLKSEPLKAGEEGDKGEEGEEGPSVWKVWLDGTERGSSYEVYAVYRGKSIGKLNVMGAEEKEVELTLVPVNGISIDEVAIEEGLCRIYGPAGVRVKVRVDRKMTGDMDWDSDGDGRLLLAGGGSWYEGGGMKESSEMVRLQKSYESKGTEGSGAVLFVLDGASGEDGGEAGLLGEMPRRNRYGYVFAGEGTGTESLVRTMAHELGHGVFTLRHTFDGEYGGDGSRGMTGNLMDYGEGTGLAAFQWNVMGNPAILTSFDREEDINDVVVTDAYLGGRYAYLSPDYRIIQKTEYIWNDGYFTFVPSADKTGTIGTLFLRDVNGGIIHIFRWDPIKKDYIDELSGLSLEGVKDATLTYYTGENAVSVKLCIPDGSHCTYKYSIITTTPSRVKEDLKREKKWKTGLYYDPDISCLDDFLDKQDKKCDGDEDENLKKLDTITTKEEATDYVNKLCLRALRRLSYEEIKDLMTIINQQRLKNRHELAILRLMSAVHSSRYPDLIEYLSEHNFENLYSFMRKFNDSGLKVWSQDNYTNFITALIKIYERKPDLWLSKIGEDYSEDLLEKVISLKTRDVAAKAKNGTAELNDKYVPEKERTKVVYRNGKLTISEEEGYNVKIDDPDGGPSRTTLVWKTNDSKEYSSDPLDPVFIYDATDLKSADAALNYDGAKGDIKVVPACFFMYYSDKKTEQNLKTAGVIALDVLTLASAAPISVAPKISWAIRVISALEVVGAVGDIAVNIEEVDEDAKAYVDAYNSIMAVVGITQLSVNVGKNVINGKLPGKVVSILKGSYSKVQASAKALTSTDFWKKMTKPDKEQFISKYRKLKALVSSFIGDEVEKMGKIDGFDDVVEAGAETADAPKTAQKESAADEVLNAASKVSEKVLKNIKNRLPKLFKSGFTESDLGRVLTDDEIERLSRHLGYKVGKEELPKLLNTEEDLLTWRGIVREEGFTDDLLKESPEWSRYIEESEFVKYITKGRLFEDAVIDKINKSPKEFFDHFLKQTGKDISKYTKLEQVRFKTTSSYSVPDLVFLKIEDKKIVDVVIVECKLNKKTAFTKMQKELFGRIISDKKSVLELSSELKIEGVTYKQISVNSDNIYSLRDHGVPELNKIDKVLIENIKSTTVK